MVDQIALYAVLVVEHRRNKLPTNELLNRPA